MMTGMRLPPSRAVASMRWGARGAHPREPLFLPLLERRVDLQQFEGLFFVLKELVHADDDAFFALDFLLIPVRGVVDFPLLVAARDAAPGAAELVDGRQVGARLLLEFVRERLDEI